MKYLALIQARMGSSRLPNKVLKDICGKPDLQWVIERVQRSTYVDEVMVITSIEKDNLPLIRLCTELGVRVFVGSEDDVLDRYYQAARLIEPEYVIRITADCPMYDWNILDGMIGSLKSDSDYCCIEDEEFPDGLDTEIIRFEALKKSWEEARLNSEREHVTQYIRNHPENFRLQNYTFPIPNTGHYRWTLDEDNDFEMIDAVYKHFMEVRKEDFVTVDVIDYLKLHPEVEAINSGIGRNEGLAKSIREDHIIEE
mgnify:CR=1 FL=1